MAIKENLTYTERAEVLDLISQGIEITEHAHSVRDKILAIIGFEADADFAPASPNEDEAWEALEAVEEAFLQNKAEQAIGNLFLSLGLHCADLN